MLSVRFSFVILLAVLSATASAQPARGVIRRVTVPAPSLVGNRLGDSAVRRASIYLPPSYARESRRRYPVIYLLHGFGADDRAFIAGAYQNLDIRVSMDSLIKRKLIREMIVVTPNARNRFDGSFYANSPATGRWEDFIVRDLVTYVDLHFRTIPKREARGIAGHSMGGFGALRVGIRHPELFSALYALSPYGLSRNDFPTGATKRAWLMAMAMRDTADIKKAGFVADLLTALTAVYSTDPLRPPFYVRFPFISSGTDLALDTTVIRRWQPLLSEIADRAADARKESIGFDAGDADGFPEIPVDVAKLDDLLTGLGVPHRAEVYHGTHGSRIRERLESVALPFFSRALTQSK